VRSGHPFRHPAARGAGAQDRVTVPIAMPGLRPHGRLSDPAPPLRSAQDDDWGAQDDDWGAQDDDWGAQDDDLGAQDDDGGRRASSVQTDWSVEQDGIAIRPSKPPIANCRPGGFESLNIGVEPPRTLFGLLFADWAAVEVVDVGGEVLENDRALDLHRRREVAVGLGEVVVQDLELADRLRAGHR